MSRKDLPKSGFEVEPATVEELLSLLNLREMDASQKERGSALRRAVHITRLISTHPTDYGFPYVKRHVQAAFAYDEEDLVTYRKLTSSQMEMPDETRKMNARQDEAYEKLREQIEQKISELGLKEEVPVLEGFLHHATDPRGSG